MDLGIRVRPYQVLQCHIVQLNGIDEFVNHSNDGVLIPVYNNNNNNNTLRLVIGPLLLLSPVSFHAVCSINGQVGIKGHVPNTRLKRTFSFLFWVEPKANFECELLCTKYFKKNPLPQHSSR